MYVSQAPVSVVVTSVIFTKYVVLTQSLLLLCVCQLQGASTSLFYIAILIFDSIIFFVLRQGIVLASARHGIEHPLFSAAVSLLSLLSPTNIPLFLLGGSPLHPPSSASTRFPYSSSMSR
ncbi:unnamed protein product, partial [Laminaria digitata]